MKPSDSSPRGKHAGGRSKSPVRIPQIPMEWMDPSGWRLPSGKALAEFALQSGFLAPLMFNAPRYPRKSKLHAEPDQTVRERDLEEIQEDR